jgi:Flp pilus assembly protein TadD
MRLPFVVLLSGLLSGLLVCCASSEKEIREDNLGAHKDPYSFHRSMSLTLLRTNQHSRAIPHIRRMIASQPDKPAGHWLLARALLGLELFSQAQVEIDRALKLKKDFAPAYSLRGVVLDTQGQHKKAETAHRKAIKLNKKALAFHNNLGFCLYLQQRYQEAIKVYSAALGISPAARRVHNNLAFAYIGAGDDERAIKHFRAVGDDGYVNNNMGLAYERQGDLKQAYEYYIKAQRADSNLPQVKVNLERVCKKLGRPVPNLLFIKEAKVQKGEPP